MKNSFLFLSFLFIFGNIINAQVLTGIVIDEGNRPLAYTTIFIEELKTGVISNDRGEFSINLKLGSYHLRFQHLGYEPKTQKVKIPNEKALTIQLKQSAIQLNEVVVKAKGEDPAYNIIRKAIAKAPFHENQLSYYKANIYFKEVSKFSTDRSKFIRRLEKLIKDSMPDLGEIIGFTEIVYDITYTPQNTEQISSGINSYIDSSFSAMGYIPEFELWNVYSENGLVSPISQNALTYYNYELINSRIVEGKKIYHICVTPKKSNSSLLTGTIDIIDSLWCVYHFDLEGKMKIPLMTIEIKFQQMFSELEKNVWVPVNYLTFMSVMFGFKVEITRTGSIQYVEYKVNNFDTGFIPTKKLVNSTEIDTSSFEMTDKYMKIQDEISKLSEKENLSKGEMLKLMNLLRKGTKELKKNNKELFSEESLELTFDNNLFIDGSAYNRDLAYWDERRIINLTSKEKEFINKINTQKGNNQVLKIDSLPLEKELPEQLNGLSKDIGKQKTEKEILENKNEISEVHYLKNILNIDSIQEGNNEGIISNGTLDIFPLIDTINKQRNNIGEEGLNTDTEKIQETPLFENDTISSPVESRILIKAPSFNDMLDSMRSKSNSKKHSFYFIGYRVELNETTSLNFRPLLKFNPVDGFSTGLKSIFKKNFEEQKIWRTDFDIAYTFKSKHFPMTVYSIYEYSPGKMGYLSISAGRKSTDFNNETGVNSSLNTLSPLFFKKNYINYYDNSFVNIEHSIEAFNGFTIDADFKHERQKELHNNTNYSFFNKSKEYRSNTPTDNPYISSNNSYLEENSSIVVQVKLTYIPRMKYAYEKNKKINISSSYPTFSLAFYRGFKGFYNGTTEFEQLEAVVNQHVSLNIFNSISYQLSGGIFPNNKNMHFSHFKHFSVYEFPFMSTSFDNKFHTLKTYSASTNEWYLSGFLKYKTAYLLIKHLPFLEGKNMNENLYVSYLKTPQINNYTEVGYAVTDIFLIGSIGLFVGFENAKYNQWGIKLSLNLSFQ